MTTITLRRDVFERIVGATSHFTNLHMMDNAGGLIGGVPWNEFVKIHATGTDVFAMAGDAAVMCIARARLVTEPGEFLLHAESAEELLRTEFVSAEFTPDGERLEVSLDRGPGAPMLLDYPTRRASMFPKFATLVRGAFRDAGDLPISVDVQTLQQITDAALRLGPKFSGIALYPRSNARAHVVATFRDELLIVFGPTRLAAHVAPTGRAPEAEQLPNTANSADVWLATVRAGSW